MRFRYKGNETLSRNVIGAVSLSKAHQLMEAWVGFRFHFPNLDFCLIEDGKTMKIEPNRDVDLSRFHGEIVVTYSDKRNAVLMMAPTDNSCLFWSLAYATLPPNRRRNLSREESQLAAETQELRRLVAEGIKEDPEKYSEAILGETRESYIKWIQDRNSWGGYIELAILAEKLEIKIIAIDKRCGRRDTYGDNVPQAQKCVILLYGGDHYDCAISSLRDGKREIIDTIFSVDDEEMVFKVEELAKRLRAMEEQSMN